jgi:hypothetical protein
VIDRTHYGQYGTGLGWGGKHSIRGVLNGYDDQGATENKPLKRCSYFVIIDSSEFYFEVVERSLKRSEQHIRRPTVFLLIQEDGEREPRAFTNSFTAALSAVLLQPIFKISL